MDGVCAGVVGTVAVLCKQQSRGHSAGAWFEAIYNLTTQRVTHRDTEGSTFSCGCCHHD